MELAQAPPCGCLYLFLEGQLKAHFELAPGWKRLQNWFLKHAGENTMSVPREGDWGDHYQADLDQDYAHKLFAGRTNQEMLPHFHSNVIERTSELRWMPKVPLRCYVLGFRDFVMAGEFNHLKASDAASCFIRIVLEKLEKTELYPARHPPATSSCSARRNESGII